MYLKRLELQGFKSFADKTVLEFKPGITSVIGPNGSGKSNISDSIRWVLGEQSMKSLRGSKAEDIIFAGTQNRKSLGFAEASIIIDNSDGKLPIEYNEVTVTRKIYRSGETGYFINKVPCRLKDILELFMDTGIGKDGYSIIGQGKIDEILSNKSEDRRHIFEEAAGIVKYRTRKAESEKKLEQTKLNLLRINDIIAEIESNKDDENWWKVYGLGLTGRPQGVVYTRWKQVPEIPVEAQLVARGLDFGFTVDPTGIVDVYKLNGELWFDELCYMRGMTNDKIADKLRGLPGSTVADSAEQKSITEIYNYGIRRIEPAEKGADSVRNGIQILQRYNLNITSRSLNLIYEIRNYKWKENKMTGEFLNEPIDKFNHLLDAVRYVALNYLKEKRPIRRPRSRYIET